VIKFNNPRAWHREQKRYRVRRAALYRRYAKYAEGEAAAYRAAMCVQTRYVENGSSCPDCHDDCMGWNVDGRRCGSAQSKRG
jgi:hypothetical protein